MVIQKECVLMSVGSAEEEWFILFCMVAQKLSEEQLAVGCLMSHLIKKV